MTLTKNDQSSVGPVPPSQRLRPSVGVPHDHCLAPGRTEDSVAGGRYQPLFPDLPALDAQDSDLLRLGDRGGMCDVGAAYDDDALSSLPAGWPFFGQFIAHDITADRSPLGQRTDPIELRNARAPRADLESLYGDGPIGAPYLYQRADPAKLLLGPDDVDVPRNHEGIALMGDPRNDSHLFVSQMHVAFAAFHNRLVDRLRAKGTAETELFQAARLATRWHYQWVILREYLPVLIGSDLTSELLDRGPELYRPADNPYMPLEFADAAFRYGHGQIRQRYRVNHRFEPAPIFPDLMGFGPVAPDRRVDWTLLFDVPGRPAAQRAKRIDGRLASSLINLPFEVSGARSGSELASLANRDLSRGQKVGLPSGEALARRMGREPIDASQVGLAGRGWEGETPLWLYILMESAALEDGDRLGPIGGRIVGEVLMGIIDADPGSYRSLDRDWTPTLPSRDARFGIVDILVSPDDPPLGAI